MDNSVQSVLDIIEAVAPEGLLARDAQRMSLEEALEILRQAVPTPRASGSASQADIDLDGLVQDCRLQFSDHYQRVARRMDGSQGPVWFGTTRPMTGADILSWRLTDAGIILVTGDGQKVLCGEDRSVINLLAEE